MLLEETPSGANLLLFSPGRREEAVRLSRGDINTFAEVFKLLDQWQREDAERDVERDR